MLRILVIDDEKDFTEIIRKHFAQMGGAVDAAFTGRDGLKMLGENVPDAVVVDNKLPDMLGVEVVKRIREINSDIPILMVSVDRREDLEAALKPFHVDRYVKKPFRFADLYDAVLDVVGASIKRKKGRSL